MRKTFIMLVIAGALSVGAHAYAHHSFIAAYLFDREISIEGYVAQFLFRMPHSFVDVIAPDVEGRDTVRWRVQWDPPRRRPGQQTVTRETVKPDDRVIITGNPGRNPADYRLLLRTIHRPSDGWRWPGVE